MSKLGLGTVQFGLNYGIANEFGKIKFSTAKEIIYLAREKNINLIDTAINYGKSEDVIGEIGISNFKVISKLPPPPENCKDLEEWIEKEFRLCLKRLKVKSIYGLLVHQTKSLVGEKGKIIVDTLNNLKSRNLVKKLGVSIYDVNELEEVVNALKIDIVQAPLNIVDRRLETSGWLSKLHRNNIEIHTRSTFLQGLLLMPRHKIPAKFNKWLKIWDRWEYELAHNNLDAKTVCLSYPLSLKEVDKIIIGVDNIEQLNEIVLASKKKIKNVNWSFMISNDQMLINPSNWIKL